ncbi:hypothetical protein V1520DRAFT_187867 [Lipomyces starkeyi]|uniref:Zn(2)-C6 fungal-type domain-containing protein n=1 Tax=Lipomyces starkeyi NRRL Y-11557 TaxID=675824 RepID=A0A1E3Q8N2_LIPST|nr:hypothetical protein LIPSTDRAFT_243514 [Lipomyces starkeyi NRRL Y-11557]
MSSKSHPTTRMRLGTRSCAECRRRKVRCIFPTQGAICQECIAHNTPCRAQQRRTSSSEDNAGSPGSQEEIQQRLRGLEDIVRQLLNRDTEQVESFTSSGDMAPSRAIRLLLPCPAPDETTDGTIGQLMNTPTSVTYHTASIHEEILEQAPLGKLFDQALGVRSDGSSGNGRIRHLQSNEYIAALKALVPRIDNLLLILESTVEYWFIWPTEPPGHNEGKGGQSYGRASMVKDFILNSFESRQPLSIVKGILWLALCVQQLPADAIKQRKSFLPALPQTIFDAYMTGAEAILINVGGSVASMDKLECLLLHTKLCINMGKPQRAWTTVRSAINCALLLGIHRPNQCRDPVQQSLWSQAWQMDRQLSSILGVPYAVPHTHYSLVPTLPVVERIMHSINSIVAKISDLNQGLTETPIEEIDTEIQTCATLFPDEWWSVIPSEYMSFDALYYRQVCKMYFFQLQKTIHLPNMLKGFDDPNIQTSRKMTIDACRNLVAAYEVLRNSSKSALVICDLMDFIVFSAALIIALQLLTQPSSRDTARDADDWNIITHLAQTFRQLAGTIECSVAKQAATLLEYLHAVHRGTYVGPEEYAAIIPWFGKVRIGSVPRRQQTISLSPQTPLSDMQVRNSSGLCNTIEFGINCAIPGSLTGWRFGPWGSQFADDELGIDWTSLDDIECDYDWMQLFYGAGYEN